MNITITTTGESKNIKNLPVIKTARDFDSINEAARNGFWPLVKKIEKSHLIKKKYQLAQNKETGEINVSGDYRMGINSEADQLVIDWTYYYPHNFDSPYAAYLIPNNLKIGERVFIEDLIEDFVGATWNQGDVYRLESSEAIWDGENLCIQYDPNKHCSSFIG
mgnify:CR=1 FL=1